MRSGATTQPWSFDITRLMVAAVESTRSIRSDESTTSSTARRTAATSAAGGSRPGPV